MYASRAALEARVGIEELAQLTDREAGSQVDEAIVDRALADADAEIDSYLALRYPVPLSPVPDLVLRLACDIARYHLHGLAAPELVQKRYDAAVKLLRALAEGAASLGLGPSGAATAAPTGGAEIAAPARVFSQDNLADY